MFTIAVAGAFAVFALANLTVWKLWTQTLLTGRYPGGDLARISYLACFKGQRQTVHDLPRRHFELDLLREGGRRVDVLTLGDSFSAGVVGGKNPFYQDYLASCSGLEVANAYPYQTKDAVVGASPLSNLLLFYNSGLLDRIRPRYVLLESVERFAMERFGRSCDFGLCEPADKLVQFYDGKSGAFAGYPKLSFLNAGNVKFVYYNLLYRFSDHAFKHGDNAVFLRRLKRPLFSTGGGRIIFVKKDLLSIPLATDQTMALLNDNLNRMADLLAQKGITLVFMPIVDKYDLYSEEIDGNRLPRSVFFEKLRPLPKRYLFIDTKKLLREEVDQGVKDVFYPDDAHWSWKASQKIFTTVRLR